MIRLTIEQVIALHDQLIAETGGSPGVRDAGLLESAIETPYQGFGGVDFYPSTEAKAARLGFQIIKNHPMVDGNKRTGTHCMLVLLALEGVQLKYTQKELYEIILSVAAGEKEYEDLLAWVLQHKLEE